MKSSPSITLRHVRISCKQISNGADLLFDNLSKEFLIPTDSSIQFVVSLLHRLGLGETLLWEWAGEERDRHIDSGNTFGISLGRDNSWRRSHGEAIPYGPVLDCLDEGILLLGLEFWRVRPALERSHDVVAER